MGRLPQQEPLQGSPLTRWKSETDSVGMGMKSLRKRNFEAGILTDDPEMLDAAIEQFDNVWIGKFFASSSINAAKNVAVENIEV